MTTEERKFNVDLNEADQQHIKKVKVGYSVAQFGGGIEKSFYSTYSSYFYTNVYMMSTAFSGVLSIISSIVGWVGAPFFGAILDKIKFKKGKYWPWLIIGSVIYNLSWILIYILPALGIKGEGTGLIALILACVAQVGSPLMTIPMNASFPLLSNDPSDRQFFAKAQKVGRDGAKTIFGYIFPVAIASLMLSTSESNAYALCVLIAGLPPIISYIWYAITLKGSYVERRATETTNTKKKSVPLGIMLKTVLTNRPLLSMFLFMSLHKTYYFIYTSCATYMFKYVFNDFSKMSLFMTVFNLTAIIGVMFGPLWKSIFKESKRCFVAAFAVHVVFLAIIAVTFKNLSANMFTLLFGISSLFMGLLENYILPFFAASSDYSAWKTGYRMDGMSMSIYSLTIKTGTLLATTIRTAMLVAADLDTVKETGVATANFISTASTLYSWIPFVIGVVTLLILVFGVNLNDERIAKINADIAQGKTMAESDLKF